MSPAGEGTGRLGFLGNAGCGLRMETFAYKGLRHPGGSDLNQLPYCYIRPSAELAVKPTNWWLRSNLNGTPGRIARGCAARPPLRSGPPPQKRRRPTRRGAG
jgi:hypothetical protein